MKVYSFDYDTEYDPPAPVVEIIVCKSGSGQTSTGITVLALVDSGADATMLPFTVLQTVGARYVETRQIRGITGVALTADLYTVTIQIGKQTVYAVRVIASLDNEAIVGRDVLNQLVVTLNGPAEVTEIS